MKDGLAGKLKEGHSHTVLIGPWSMRVDQVNKAIRTVKTKNVVSGTREHKRESYNVRQRQEQQREIRNGIRNL